MFEENFFFVFIMDLDLFFVCFFNASQQLFIFIPSQVSKGKALIFTIPDCIECFIRFLFFSFFLY